MGVRAYGYIFYGLCWEGRPDGLEIEGRQEAYLVSVLGKKPVARFGDGTPCDNVTNPIDRRMKEKVFGFAEDWLEWSRKALEVMEELPVEFDRYDSDERGIAYLKSSRTTVEENHPHRLSPDALETPPDGASMLREHCARFQLPFDETKVGWWFLPLRV